MRSYFVLALLRVPHSIVFNKQNTQSLTTNLRSCLPEAGGVYVKYNHEFLELPTVADRVGDRFQRSKWLEKARNCIIDYYFEREKVHFALFLVGQRHFFIGKNCLVGSETLFFCTVACLLAAET